MGRLTPLMWLRGALLKSLVLGPGLFSCWHKQGGRSLGYFQPAHMAQYAVGRQSLNRGDNDYGGVYRNYSTGKGAFQQRGCCMSSSIKVVAVYDSNLRANGNLGTKWYSKSPFKACAQ